VIANNITEFLIPAAFSNIIARASMPFCFKKSAQKHKIEWILAFTCNFYLTLSTNHINNIMLSICKANLIF